jgi:mono/diheme cytochrome c family protein
MTTRSVRRCGVAALALFPGILLLTGDWAVTTVENLPDYAVAGRPLTLAFTVREYGQRLYPGLRPRIEARNAELSTGATAAASTFRGRYVASILLPRPGDWTITIHADVQNKMTLPPIRAVDPGRHAPAAPSDFDRGRRLFVAKGCATCHVEMRAGPELTSKRYATDYLRKAIATPELIFPRRPGRLQMPNLNLKPHEIDALVAYLSVHSGVATK